VKVSRPDRLEAIAAAALERRCPVYLLIIATKPCYIKLASLVKVLRERAIPTLVIDAGQHYDSVLVGAAQEFSYVDEIDIFLEIRGTLLARTGALALQTERLHEHLSSRWAALRFVPIVSGDTSTSGTFPIFWYLQTGIRTIHVEAGLRSQSPFDAAEPPSFDSIVGQTNAPWHVVADEPFPEGADTRLTSVVSSLLLAPVQRNVDSLLAEGYSPRLIRTTGSLSADAVRLARPEFAAHDIARLHPELDADRRWLRVDIHRRENMTLARLRAVVGALCRLAGEGLSIIFIVTNQFRFAMKRHSGEDFLGRLTRAGVHCHDLWPSYLDVVAFLASERCLALYTDSGGLQEEAQVLGVPCMTCRFSTDRPETILDTDGNLLIPPVESALIARAIAWRLGRSQRARPGEERPLLYGDHVAESIAGHLASTLDLQ